MVRFNKKTIEKLDIVVMSIQVLFCLIFVSLFFDFKVTIGFFLSTWGLMTFIVFIWAGNVR